MRGDWRNALERVKVCHVWRPGLPFISVPVMAYRARKAQASYDRAMRAFGCACEKCLPTGKVLSWPAL